VQACSDVVSGHPVLCRNGGTKKLPQLPKQGSPDADGCVARYLPRSPACGIMLVGRWCYAPGRGPALGLTH
jgi:hypothetical protein